MGQKTVGMRIGHGGRGWVLGMMFGAGCGGLWVVAADEFARPSVTEAESVLADLSWIEGALNERASLVGQASLPVPGSNNFVRLKSFCVGLMPFFIDPGCADGAGDFSVYLDNYAGVLPVLKATGLTARLQMPTNYFGYTPIPWGSVQEITNASTGAGGIGFPVGQTAWTVADYGPVGLRRVLQQMVWTKATPYWKGAGSETNVRWTGGEWAVTWSECAIYCAANWPETAYTGNLGPHSGTTGYMFYEGCYYFRYMKIWNDLEVAGLPTHRAHALDFYIKCGVSEDPYLPTLAQFDAQGVSNLRDGYSRIDQTAADQRARVSIRVGDEGNTPLTWCLEPDDTAVTFRGWEAKAISAVVRWDVPGGVRY